MNPIEGSNFSTVAEDELMDENSNPIAGLAGTLPNDVILEIPPDQYMMWSGKAKAYKNRFHSYG